MTTGLGFISTPVAAAGIADQSDSTEYNETAIREGAITVSLNPYDWEGTGRTPELVLDDEFKGETEYLERKANDDGGLTMKYRFNSSTFDSDVERYVVIAETSMTVDDYTPNDNDCNISPLHCRVETSLGTGEIETNNEQWGTVRLPIDHTIDSPARDPYIQFEPEAPSVFSIRINRVVAVPEHLVTYLTDEEVLAIIDAGSGTDNQDRATESSSKTSNGGSADEGGKSTTEVAEADTRSSDSVPDEDKRRYEYRYDFGDRGLFLPSDGLFVMDITPFTLSVLGFVVSIFGIVFTMWRRE